MSGDPHPTHTLQGFVIYIYLPTYLPTYLRGYISGHRANPPVSAVSWRGAQIDGELDFGFRVPKSSDPKSSDPKPKILHAGVRSGAPPPNLRPNRPVFGTIFSLQNSVYTAFRIRNADKNDVKLKV